MFLDVTNFVLGAVVVQPLFCLDAGGTFGVANIFMHKPSFPYSVNSLIKYPAYSDTY